MKFLNFFGKARMPRQAAQSVLLGLAGALLAITLTACANEPLPTSSAGAPLTAPSGRDYLPGGYWMYAWGIAQTKENFVNVERAQDSYQRNAQRRLWAETKPISRPTGTVLGLQSYLPLHVRWKLKDGREFILENIDIRKIMQEYFKTHDIKLQWQLENRSEAKVGDGFPILAHEVKDDQVLIKWFVLINRTPVNKRLTETGAATKWDIAYDEYFVTSIHGKPTSGINFSNDYEFFK